MPVKTSSTAQVPITDYPQTGPEAIVRNTIAKADQLKQKKVPWNDQFQLLGEFIHLRKQEFQSQHTVGEFLTRDIFDATGPKAAKTAASMLVALLWPKTDNRMALTPPRGIQDTEDNKEYYEEVTRILIETMDSPKVRFGSATAEYMLDQVVFGTSGVEIVPDKENDVRCTPWGVTYMYIGEGKDGKVDTIYVEVETNSGQLVKDYGLDAVSEKTREDFEQGRHDTKVTLLMAIEPRISRVHGKKGNKNLEFSSVHIEREAKHLLKESGFADLPVVVGRLTKLIGEEYGRSLGMDATPDILELNAIWESVTIAIEKSLDPPLGLYNDGVLGGGFIDTSAGAINVFNPSDQAKDRQPIFQLQTIGEFKQIVGLIEKLSNNIADHFLIDRLLDFNNETRMTATETNIRDRDRNSTLHQILQGQIDDYFIPSIERFFNILLAAGKLGVLPDSEDAQLPGALIIPPDVAELMKSGQDVFNIQFTTPATRIMQAEELGGIETTIGVVGRFVELGREDALDVLDIDETIRLVNLKAGSTPKILNSLAKIKETRDSRAQMQQQQMEIEQAQALTDGMRNVGQSGLVPTMAPEKRS